MVRLKVWNKAPQVLTQMKFQFHYGTIKREAQALGTGTSMLFQFHYGTIKRGTVQGYRQLYAAISIPLWYD